MHTHDYNHPSAPLNYLWLPKLALKNTGQNCCRWQNYCCILAVARTWINPPTSPSFTALLPLTKPASTQLLLAPRSLSAHTHTHKHAEATLLCRLLVLPPLQPGGRSNWSRLSCCPATYGSQPWQRKTKDGDPHRSWPHQRFTRWVRQPHNTGLEDVDRKI